MVKILGIWCSYPFFKDNERQKNLLGKIIWYSDTLILIAPVKTGNVQVHFYFV